MRTRKSSVKKKTKKHQQQNKQKGEVWMKCTAQVTYSGGLGGIWEVAHLFGILSLGSVCRKMVRSEYMEEFWSVTSNICQKKRDSYGLKVDEEACEYFQEGKSRSEWCLRYFLCCNLIMNLYFDLIFKCFNLLYKKYILIYRPHWGTGTVTLAFSFLEDVI